VRKRAGPARGDMERHLAEDQSVRGRGRPGPAASLREEAAVRGKSCLSVEGEVVGSEQRGLRVSLLRRRLFVYCMFGQCQAYWGFNLSPELWSANHR